MSRPWLTGNGNTFPTRKLFHVASLKARIGWQSLRTDEFVDEGPYCVTGTDFKKGKVDWSTAYHVGLERYQVDGNIQINEGDLLVTKDGTIGKVAVVDYLPDLTTLNSGVFVVRPKLDTLETSFLAWVIQSKVFDDFVAYNFSGSTINHLYQNVFETFRFPYPDLATQRRIADFLDRETARLDLLIEKKQRLVATVAPRFQALIHAANESAIWQRFGFCATYSSRPIPPAPEISYTRLGLYNRGRGFFKKNEAPFEDLGDSSFFFVREGDLVFSGQFAWEGSVGLITSNEDGCVVSHRYPVYVGKNGVLSEYLYAYFRTHHGQFLMENCSRGAAGRNRPLNSRILEKEKIPIPSPDLQEAVKKVVYFERSLKDKTNPSIDRLKEYRSALITAAVTGQIDVEAHAKSGSTERRLVAIEMGANA